MRLFTTLALSTLFFLPLYCTDDINVTSSNQTHLKEKSLLISDEDGMLDANEYLATKIQPTTSFQDADFHPAGGVGFRYELARKFGLWGGLDFATSEDKDLAFYITVGSAWGAF